MTQSDIKFPSGVGYVSVRDLKTYDKNSRTHSIEQVDQIVASIQEFGFTNPILVDENQNVIAGHGRLLAAKKLELERVPAVVIQGLTEGQRRAYVIADNKLALNAGWDFEILKSELELLNLDNFDIDKIGFSNEELSSLLADFESQQAEPEPATPDAEPAPDEEADETETDSADHEAVETEEKSEREYEREILPKPELSKIYLGDCLKIMGTLPAESIDAVVTDPPYGLEFMNKHWDYDVPTVTTWREVMRILKPGGHVLAFGGTRTYHRLVVNIEDAGFEIRDQLQWIYGSGFPKSMDISKAIDKAAGAEREVIGPDPMQAGRKKNRGQVAGMEGTYAEQTEEREAFLTKPATPEAKQWAGWGTALKPANEPICLARKPVEGTIASNVLRYGTGALNIDASRIEYLNESDFEQAKGGNSASNRGGNFLSSKGALKQSDKITTQGRFPSNLLLDETAAALLDQQSGTLKSGAGQKNTRQSRGNTYGVPGAANKVEFVGDSGGASRFFYVAKSSKSERNGGLTGIDETKTNDGREKEIDNAYQRGSTTRQNSHPTVKPIRLMQYLVRMITPPGGTVIDPFMGSGTTGIAATSLEYRFIGCERDENYFKIAEARLK